MAKLPYGGRSSLGLVNVPGVVPPAPLPGFAANVNRVSGGYFHVMQIPLLRGREFGDGDDERAKRVAIVNATMAARLWPGRDPIGQTFTVGQGNGRFELEVVGVAADAEARSPGQAPFNFYYVPLAQFYNAQAVLQVRARPGVADAIIAPVRRTIRELDASLPIAEVRPLVQELGIFLLPQRLAAWLSGAMGAFGLLLAGIGVYGVTAFAISRRARELAIRVALGATSGQVARLVLVRGLRAPLIGMAIGMGVAAVLTIGVRQVMSGVRAGDPLVFGGVVLAIGAMLVVAMAAPLSRVLRSNPMRALREE